MDTHYVFGADVLHKVAFAYRHTQTQSERSFAFRVYFDYFYHFFFCFAAAQAQLGFGFYLRGLWVKPCTSHFISFFNLVGLI